MSVYAVLRIFVTIKVVDIPLLGLERVTLHHCNCAKGLIK